MAEIAEEEEYIDESQCLVLTPDDKDGDIKLVKFVRDINDIQGSVAKTLELPASERVRCFHLPMFEKVVGWSVHMYIDLEGVNHQMAHNTNATQLWLVANLPSEPPELFPDSIHGPVLLTAEDFHTEEYVSMDRAAWLKLIHECLKVQPNAQFVGLSSDEVESVGQGIENIVEDDPEYPSEEEGVEEGEMEREEEEGKDDVERGKDESSVA
eukprot:CAMPEP_0175052416 /NCGR_PEP_ID=MMETSP0052_2-20121109/8349_1 /TAXON_ID=51329 ORGANISM="Polytomella parva, Strain SAG 63-3" /NCGR_SAMPLE_ID=MMETSP0052_2 /ASSEMBLY_ACC=CAM_ASM_000194 /LENGTH=210 /DNA_ID=CAMNT_0016316821 /DNA_START=59 /DNA_END=691 /DNA_ORIENTATION=-